MEFARNKLVALLPMKAHSARIEGKNFRNFAGKPLFRWILDTLLEIQEIELIVINTDARDILATYGLASTDRILIRDRASELCGDDVSMNKVILDDLENVPADTYLMTHTTNPLLSALTISSALTTYHEQVIKEDSDSLFTVNRFQTRFYRPDGSPVNHDPSNLLRTQDLEVWFEENSNLYIFSPQSFATTHARIGRSPHMFETPPAESLDIDDHPEWELAELVAFGMQKCSA